MKPTTRDWIAAFSRFSRDPDAKVACPECPAADLELTVTELPDASGWDMHLACPICRAHNVLTVLALEHLRKPSTSTH